MEAVRECDWCLPLIRSPVEYLAVGGCLERLHVRVYHLCRGHCLAVRDIMASSELYCHEEAAAASGYCRIAEVLLARCDEPGMALEVEAVTASGAESVFLGFLG